MNEQMFLILICNLQRNPNLWEGSTLHQSLKRPAGPETGSSVPKRKRFHLDPVLVQYGSEYPKLVMEPRVEIRYSRNSTHYLNILK